VRGVFNKSQTPNQVYKLAETGGFVFGKGKYGLGWDGRKSSFVLARAAACGVLATGSDVVAFGLVPTPLVAFGSVKNRCLAGFSVTASHNPPEFSGVKLFDASGMELDESTEVSVERALVVDSWKSVNKVGSVIHSEDVVDDYTDALLARFGTPKRQLKIVVDCANGPGGNVTPYVLSRLGHRVIPVNSQISWRFTARQPEPTVENLRDTCNLVRESGADLGLAHDGDADRLVIINSLGQLVSDALMPIIFLRSLTRTGRIILSENTSSAVADEAGRLGFDVIRGRIGKTFTEIKKNDAILASEPSKVVDPSWGMWEDGMYAALTICDAISKDTSLLGSITRSIDWFYRQVNLPVGVDLNRLSARVEDVFARFKIQEKREMFGLKILFKDGSWIMFRSSGTEPKTRIYCESKDLLRLEELLQEGVKCVETSSQVLNQVR
jgi:phosphomannomutase